MDGMKLRTLSYLLIGLATAVVLVSLAGLFTGATDRQPLRSTETQRVVQAKQPLIQNRDDVPTLPTPQVVVGTPEFYPDPQRYTYRQESVDGFPWRTLYVIDEEANHEVRLGSDRGFTVVGNINNTYLLWYFFCGTNCTIPSGLHAYTLTSGEDKLVYSKATDDIGVQIGGDWTAFGHHNGRGNSGVSLYAANIVTSEVITLTRNLGAQGSSIYGGYFGISEQLAAWFEGYDTIVVYDLERWQELTRLTDIYSAFGEHHVTIDYITPGESVITWSGRYGYDLVTHSYFRIENRKPADWGEGLIRRVSRIQEKDRLLTWTYTMQDGTTRHVRAPLLDATPSTELCAEEQNLVQNGDLETVADHARWQQTDNSSDLIVDELPTGLATSGTWAIRLGRYAHSHAAIRQQIEIPSGVSALDLTFDVRALSWDIWGGDRLQVDLIDPLTGNSLLATPVQWTNVELASGDWLPMQVIIETWPGINTPVELVFQVQTDWALPTDFIVDNIALTTTCQ